jgi:hypothetical protein
MSLHRRHEVRLERGRVDDVTELEPGMHLVVERFPGLVKPPLHGEKAAEIAGEPERTETPRVIDFSGKAGDQGDRVVS